MIGFAHAVGRTALVLVTVGFVPPCEVYASDCTTAVVALNARLPSTGELTGDNTCEVSQTLSRNLLGKFQSGLSVCVRKESDAVVNIVVEGEPDASGNRSKVGQIQIQTDSSRNASLSIYDPTVKPDVPQTVVYLVPSISLENVNEPSVSVESVTVSTAECVVSEKIVFVKTAATEAHDEFNVRTKELDSAYK